MHIVTDSGADLFLAPDEIAALGIQVVPLTVTLSGRSYREGLDIGPEEFTVCSPRPDLPTTSQPSAGEFADVYRRLLRPIGYPLRPHPRPLRHGGLCQRRDGARGPRDGGLQDAPVATGWQVAAAARRAGRPGARGDPGPPRRIADATSTLFTLEDEILIHGRRISP